jgi:flagellar biosynthetic protein FliP
VATTADPTRPGHRRPTRRAGWARVVLATLVKVVMVVAVVMVLTVVAGLSLLGPATPAAADPATTSVTLLPGAPAPTPTSAAPALPSPTPPVAPTATTIPAPSGTAKSGSGQITVNLGGALNKPSESLTIIIFLTLLSVAPAMLIMLTSFTRVIIVLSLTRNALGLQTIPPNQVLAGLALFITLFIMSPVITTINHDSVQPYLHNKITQTVAIQKAETPLKAWMMKQTRSAELTLFIDHSTAPKPKTPNDVGLTTLIPAFVLSELKSAFIIGFVIFIPFLVIDLIVSSSLMSMGMMMLPPVLVSLPFKILLFVLVDGWALIVKSLLTSYR